MGLGAVQWTCLAVATLALVGTGLGAALPQIAPSVMTMDTMDRLFDIGRYEDTGACEFWVVNMSQPVPTDPTRLGREQPFNTIERDFACGFFWDWQEREGQIATIHEALWDHEEDQVFQVPHMERGNLEEWYRVDGHMLTDEALSFQLTASTDPGVLMPPPGAKDKVTMGWVSSGGEPDGQEVLIHPRELVETGNRTYQGIETVVWESSFQRERVTWHGYDVLLTEEVSLASDPRTGWILEMERYVLVEMTPGQMADAFGFQLPLENGEPRAVMELVYKTTEQGTADHIEEDGFFRRLVAPIEEHRAVAGISSVPAALFGSVGLVVASNRRP